MCCRNELQASEERYQAQKQVTQTLGVELLKLYSQLEMDRPTNHNRGHAPNHFISSTDGLNPSRWVSSFQPWRWLGKVSPFALWCSVVMGCFIKMPVSSIFQPWGQDSTRGPLKCIVLETKRNETKQKSGYFSKCGNFNDGNYDSQIKLCMGLPEWWCWVILVLRIFDAYLLMGNGGMTTLAILWVEVSDIRQPMLTKPAPIDGGFNLIGGH